MKVHHNITEFTSSIPVVTIGTFDGVHVGHKHIISELVVHAKSTKGESVIFTLWPHPKMVLRPNDHSINLLNTLEEKIKQFDQLGVDHLIVFPFTEDFSQLTAGEFIKHTLVDMIGLHTLVVGFDHHIGKNREGDFDSISSCAEKYNFRLIQTGALIDQETNISSTVIRQLIETGKIPQANKYLGYEYELSGKVIKGNKLGTSIGFPTANIYVADNYKLIPPDGVYAVFVDMPETSLPGMLYIGNRPTLNNSEQGKSIEVNIFGFSQELYNKDITVRFMSRTREDIKFSNMDELKSQLKIDEQIVKKVLKI